MGNAIQILFLGFVAIFGIGQAGIWLAELTGLEFLSYIVIIPFIAFVLYLFWIIVLN